MINRFALSFVCIELDRNEIYGVIGLYILLLMVFSSFLFFFIPGLCGHLGLISFFRHAALFVALYAFSASSVISLLHAYFHLRFGHPLLLFPDSMSTSSILLSMWSSLVLLTWPYHFCRLSVFFSWTLPPFFETNKWIVSLACIDSMVWARWVNYLIIKWRIIFQWCRYYTI